MIDRNILDRLNAKDADARLENLRAAAKGFDFPPQDRRYINNHIHTIYSFSPYSPSAAVFAAKAEGLSCAGIVDHDSIAGAAEFIRAGTVIGLPTTVGLECRVSMVDTPFADRRTNSPDQCGLAYMTMQSVPHANIDKLDAAFVPLRARREDRNRRMTDNINEILSGCGIEIDYKRDVRTLSEAERGGTVTERHLMLAVARHMIARRGADRITETLADAGVALSDKQRSMMLDTGSPYFEYDLVGILKSAFVKKIYVPATDECLTLAEAEKLCHSVGAIFCYAYIGDVTASVTGDKAAQKFEDDYIDELAAYLASSGVDGITYMPTRNTSAQLARVRGLCEKHGLMQVSGEDVNSPRQSFIVRAMEDPEFANLIDSTHYLIRHERAMA